MASKPMFLSVGLLYLEPPDQQRPIFGRFPQESNKDRHWSLLSGSALR
jgi:hypothetical protein